MVQRAVYVWSTTALGVLLVCIGLIRRSSARGCLERTEAWGRDTRNSCVRPSGWVFIGLGGGILFVTFVATLLWLYLQRSLQAAPQPLQTVPPTDLGPPSPSEYLQGAEVILQEAERQHMRQTSNREVTRMPALIFALHATWSAESVSYSRPFHQIFLSGK